jgi:hypothetical protein
MAIGNLKFLVRCFIRQVASGGLFFAFVPCRDFFGSFWVLFLVCSALVLMTMMMMILSVLPIFGVFFHSLSLGSMGISDWSGDHGIFGFLVFCWSICCYLWIGIGWDWTFYIWVRVGWRRRGLWLAGVNFFFTWVSILVFFIFGLSSFILGHDEFLVPLFSIFMGSRAQRFFFYRAIELERMVVPVPATLY